ncbi:MAG: FixH family protein [Rhizobiaceae bacterium]|nr:FixH family protein [Rhizobiaceae bacterium]
MRVLPIKYVVIGAILVTISAAWIVMSQRHAPPADLDLARSKQSVGGIYTVTLESEAEPVKTGPLHSWIAAVKSADGTPIVDATIQVDGGMPNHGHGLPTAPQASHIGDGHYRIEGVRFNMGGWWELHLRINGPAGDDEVTFNIVL